MRYLLDTNVLSEPARARPDLSVLEQLEEHGGQSCTAAIVLHELRYGMARLAHGRRRRVLERYLDEVVARLDVLAYDRQAAVWHAATRARLEARGQSTSFVDAQIAAVAAVNELTVVTRNVDHFATLDVKVATWHTPLGQTFRE
ncbi:MAG: type II toxin-antitoxin system VapC family toxin [Euzebyaceae bacterium]|nr:type II toxin-antitoxin system VapC family toxin [Euzebyaceae bacterium]